MIDLIQHKRRICFVKGCEKLTRNKGRRKGKRIYGIRCAYHHDNYYKRGFSFLGYPKKIPNKKCEQCGWDKSFCDRHRIIPELGYTRENVRVLCPNCHRLAG